MEWLGAVWFVGHGPIAASLIIGLFWAALAHPDRIRSPLEFRLSALCLGASVALSAAIPVFVLSGSRGDRRDALTDAMCLYPVPAALTMLAILLGVDSVAPRRSRPEPGSRVTPPTELR